MAKESVALKPGAGWLTKAGSFEDVAAVIGKLIDAHPRFGDTDVVFVLNVESIPASHYVCLEVLALVSSHVRRRDPAFRLARRFSFQGSKSPDLADRGNSLLKKADELAEAVAVGTATRSRGDVAAISLPTAKTHSI